MKKRYEAESHIENEQVDEIAVDQDISGEEASHNESGVAPATPAGPSRAQWLTWAAFGAVILLGAVLRFWGLGDKPLHHDESLHAYFSLQLMHDMEHWTDCFNGLRACYHYDPLLHGPFQFHGIALVYKISQWLGVSDHGVNTTTVRILAATLGTIIVGLPYLIRDRLSTSGAWIASLLLAVSPGMVYFSRFAREDIYMACFTLLLVVSVARYLSTRRAGWLILAAIAFAFSYATKEATFLTIAIYGSFFGALIVWELGMKWHPFPPLIEPASRLQSRWRFRVDERKLPHSGALFATWLYFLLAVPLGLIFFAGLKALSLYITNPKNVETANAFVERLKLGTLTVVPWIGVLLGLFVLSILLREAMGRLPAPGRRGLARRIDPEKQPLLDTLFTMPWTHWFFALLSGWFVFLILFTVLFSYIPYGIADGIWQGLYYWLQQQQVARGGQPWYYYLLLIPLYEQIGLVFGLVGGVRALLRPTRFRLFLVYWFVGNVFIYSWAAEKMPWLSIHMTMPMLLLAAVGLEPAATTLANFARERLSLLRLRPSSQAGKDEQVVPALPAPGRAAVSGRAVIGAVLTLLLAVLLLAPTLQNMYQVSYVHAADGPHEMMVYVQTTTDVNTVMAKIDALDRQLYGGQRRLPIGVTGDAVWPFIWYLRDYTNVTYVSDSKDICALPRQDFAVVLAGGDCLYLAQMEPYKSQYRVHQYHMRTWWDEGYKPPACQPTATSKCEGQPTWGGVGPLLWLSYGDNPPPHAQFDVGRAISNIWQWWWQRKAIGSTTGSYDMDLFINVKTGGTP
ncbi:MAG: TIGR03663 family protein [Ktedonobacteraceae bacterium]|nr:TIGR03663 family protein [Ktedonobacteraceae bacterium]